MNADTTELATSLKRAVERKFGKPMPIIIAVDQGEELLIEVGQEGAEERLTFWKVLKNLLASGHNIFLVTTVRQELYSRFVRQLPTNFTPKRFPLLALTRNRYDEIIKLPFSRFDRRFDAPLIERLVDDVSDPKLSNPLPLLAFTLQRLWEITDENIIKESYYKGLANALVEATDKVVEDLAKALSGVDVPYDQRKEKALVELSNFLFRHFITVDKNGVAVSRREIRSEITGRTSDEILKRLRNSRIIVEEFGLADGNEGNEPYQLAHEGLIHQWAWLQTELEHRKEDFILRTRLVDAAEVWKSDQEDKGSAIMNLSNRRKVLEISEGNVTRFSDKFEEKTGAKIDKLVQRFVEACEEVEAKRAKEMRRQLVGWRWASFIALVLFLGSAGSWVYIVLEHNQARLTAAVDEARAAEETAKAAVAATAASEQDKLATLEALKTKSQGCWQAKAPPVPGSCWTFQISLVNGAPIYSCGGDGREALTVGEGSLARSNGESFSPSGSSLVSVRYGDALNVYARCDAKNEAAVQKALARSR